MGGFSGDGGPATSALLNSPQGVAVDSAGNLYIADNGNSRIRKVSNGVITTVAGNGTLGFSGDNGPATSAQLNRPFGVAVDSAGDLYIADAGNNRIRKISNGVITTVAGSGAIYEANGGLGSGASGFGGDGGPAISALLSDPEGVALDSAGNLYIADTYNSRIRKVSNGVITTVAGNGTYGFSGDGGQAVSAQLDEPYGVAVDSASNLYIADWQNNRIRKVSNGVIDTIAGDSLVGGFSGDNGPATKAELYYPFGVAVDSVGNVYVADTFNYRIRALSPLLHSCLMQDEPEPGTGFSYKMSLKGKIGMLGVAHQHGRFRSGEPGADAGVPGGQRRGALWRPTARGSVRLDRADVGATPVRRPGPAGQGFGAALPGPDDGSQPRPGDAADHGLSPPRAGASGGLSTDQVRHALHGGGFGPVGLRRPSAWELERTGDPAHPGARIQPIQPGCLPASGGDLGGPPVPAAQFGGLSQTQHQLPTHTAHGDSHRRAAQAPAARLAGLSPHRHRASGRSGWTQRAVSHQRRRPGDAVGNCGCHPADLRTVADAGAGSPAGTVPLHDSRLSLRQRQRIYQLQRGASAEQTAHRTNQVASASFGRQRPGGSEKRRHHPQAHRLRPYRRATRRGDGSVPPRAPESVRQLPSSLRRAQGPHRSQRQAPPRLRAMGHSIRVVPGITWLRELPAAAGRAGGAGSLRPDTIRSRSSAVGGAQTRC